MTGGKSHGRGLPHGVIGNGGLIALIHPDSGIDWLCVPRFDGPSVFGRLLDEEKGGTWRIVPEEEVVARTATYIRNTNVLRSEYVTASGSFEIVDFMPRIPRGLHHETPLRLTRVIRPLDGAPRIRINFDPRPNYGTHSPEFVPHPDGICFRASGVELQLVTDLPGAYVSSGNSFRLDQPRYLSLELGTQRNHQSYEEVDGELTATIGGWQTWTQGNALADFEDELVLRSALCLKLLTFTASGAIIAAATTSIPETIGEPRTWDYRYCWLRDSVFTVEAFRRLGQLKEGRDFMRYVLEVADSGALQPLYGIGGERDLPESTLDHLAGFAGTRPVRIGNAAATQLQTDLMGEVVLCMRTLLTDKRLPAEHGEFWLPLLERMVDEAVAAFDVPDLGIWEYRSDPRLHLFSRAMCWAAAHHGAALADELGATALAASWRSRAASMRAEVLERGFNKRLGMFTQDFDGEHPDAANLLLPSIGLISARDPRFLSTIDAYRHLLVRDHGVMRYIHPDDFGTPKSCFTICSFWWAEALALAGHLDEAKERFCAVAKHANPLGLFSEDTSVADGELVGNFPQAYTHVGLINAALTIGTLLRARSGRFHAWS